MRKTVAMMLVLILAFSLCACGKESSAAEPGETGTGASEVQMESTEPETGSGGIEAGGNGEEPADGADGSTPITLTIGETVLHGYLNDSVPARSLIAQLPLTVTLNDSDNDFCGGSIAVEYGDSDVQSGYKNGDLTFWPPAGNFVIFVDDEENSADTGNLVMLGKITEAQEVLDALEGTIEVTVALADGNAETEEAGMLVSEETESGEVSEVKVKITVGETELIATMEDNATTQAIIEQMPMTLPMMDLYGREMCYRYGAYALPTDDLRSDGYEVGDLAYWAPGGSLVILYKQNGEEFERQHLGHIDSGVEVFESTGDVDVTFELVE